ncbi:MULTISPECIES: hypothetical protein [unclassified Gilliamella]|uniref:hypothetical protein n=1 Tax=unclassified Gilliamella TaxID=2685620 RepID=UPI002269ED34|nr:MULTISPECIES: hypothetical protein [unclassified Gilliamella]MCX8588953.1 hypothetical protein [Gilliamella sp. B3801]MCX8592109.1 hypothetical protein [Gilliamella sp. B3804]
MNLDKKFSCYLLLNILVSALISYLFSSTVTKNKDAMNLIVNTFSILSGFLFIVIAAIGELAIFNKEDSSAEKIRKHDNFNIRFIRFSSLFVLYLFVLLTIFIGFLLENAPMSESIFYKSVLETTQNVIPYIITFSACFCFLASIQLPWSLKRFIEEKNETN